MFYFRSPEGEGKLCNGGSALRVVKLIALSSAIRVSFWAFYELWTLTFHSRLIQTQSSWQSAKAKKAALNLAKLWLTIKTWIKLRWKMYNINIFIRQQVWERLKCFRKPWFLCTVFVFLSLEARFSLIIALFFTGNKNFLFPFASRKLI